ncbi:Short-chain dehydrogenase/reductase SDR [Caballeronia hypogeia]|uniref:Short-chain dehydrogenase/reductase SDR n=1 Tax=Caballeronia hypogeia TaxID=1777140 RepID=A0A158CZN2_9BURK|nr:SDR family oxidoreductase [Caballeronia hypogeia]SAK87739.1 Short-chain dehydrogenase/reductase SDR [Caballeronia hypogeia]
MPTEIDPSLSGDDVETNHRVAIVTGAAGGIGGAVCIRLAERGWSVVLAARTEKAAAEVLSRCRALNAEAEVFPGDVTQAQYMRDLVAFAVERFGRLDGFVSNAGLAGHLEAVTDYPDEVFDLVMNVNVRATFLALKHSLPALRASGGGSFVATASTSAIRGRANLSAYVASKHAVLGLVRSAALECIGTGARVNAVLPGPIQTALIDSLNEMASKRGNPITRATQTPYGKPEDVANTVAFLLSSESSHMNGASIVLDAGSTVA